MSILLFIRSLLLPSGSLLLPEDSSFALERHVSEQVSQKYLCVIKKKMQILFLLLFERHVSEQVSQKYLSVIKNQIFFNCFISIVVIITIITKY